MDNIFKVSVIIPVYNAAEFFRTGTGQFAESDIT